MYTKFDKQIDELIAKMTLREKIGQLNQPIGPLNEQELVEIKEAIRRGEIGSILMAECATAGNDPQSHINADLYNELQRIAVEESRLGIPMIFGRDVIHGHKTVYPIPLATAAAFNDELVTKCYRNVAKEATANGIHWTFSPMLDLCHDPRWGRIIEGPGEDPYVGAHLAAAMVKGFQGDDLTSKTSMVACAKHYLGYGASEGGRDYHRTEISDYTLYNYILPAFRAAVDAGVGTFMSSFNDISGQPVTSSRKYLYDILRGELGFNGFVVSDWEAIKQLERQGVANDRADCARMALNAGLDMDMRDACYIENLEQLVLDGKVSVETIDWSVKNVLRVKFAKGIFDSPYYEGYKVDRTEHINDARELARECMVLLKNDGVLPLEKNTAVAAAGPFLKERRALLGSWTLDGDADKTKNFFEAMKEVLSQNGGWLNVNEDTTDIYTNIDVISAWSEVIVLALGESHLTTGENRATASIELDKAQIELIRRAKMTGKKVVGVFFCGRPRAMENVADMLDAIIYAWHSGSETANAVCDILFGDFNPCGRTPITFLRKTGHIPLYYNVTSSGRPVNSYYHENPYWSYVDGAVTPYYPFGYGLSYTEFEYSNIKVDKDQLSAGELKAGESFTVTLDVKNVGKMDGKEVVQLYIRDRVASMMRPIRELKGYAKPFIKAGESAKVEFMLGYKELGFYLETGEYTLEKGEIEIYVGKNCLVKDCLKVQIN